MTARRARSPRWPHLLALVVAASSFGLAAPAASQDRAAEEWRTLDIEHTHIAERGFVTGLNLVVGDPQAPLHVEIGVGLTAEGVEIDVYGARGRYRFHADATRLRQVLQRIEAKLPEQGIARRTQR